MLVSDRKPPRVEIEPREETGCGNKFRICAPFDGDLNSARNGHVNQDISARFAVGIQEFRHFGALPSGLFHRTAGASRNHKFSGSLNGVAVIMAVVP
jgi:hypothetical protein